MIKQFDTVLATFQPQRTDDLRPEAREWIGVRTHWHASFYIDFGPYAGQMAMLAWDFNPEKPLVPMGWVPFCDLADVVELG